MSNNKGKELVPFKKLGFEIQKGDHYSYEERRQRKITRNSNGQTSYECEEKAAVITKNGKSSTTKVVVHERRVEEIHYESRPAKEITHFSHRHALHRYNLQKHDKIACNICESYILDKAWTCEKCKFFIHKSCENIPREINHKSHRRDSLSLRSSTHYQSGKFYCNACRYSGKGFHYHCSPCKFDLHVACAGSPSTVYYQKHKNPLTLCYDFPINTSKTVYCEVCHAAICKNGWVYYNKDSRFIAHIHCAFINEKTDSILLIQDRLQSLQIKGAAK